jgi:hypothetical protein
VLMLGLFIPHLDLIARTGRWVLAVGSAALALGLLFVGSVSAGFDVRHPQPDSIMYALNTDTGEAVWISADQQPDAWTTQFLGAEPRRSSVADQIGDPAPKLHAPAPPVALAAPSVRLLDVRNHDAARTVTMRVTGPARANLIVLETDLEVTDATINGAPVANRPLAYSSQVLPWTLSFWNPPSQGFDVTLKVAGNGALRVTARASTPGLPPIPGTVYRERPQDTMPVSANPATIEQESSTAVSRTFSLVKP